MDKKLQIRNSTAEFLIFTSQAGKDGIEVRFENETIWLSQKLMAVLFDCSTDNISLHLKNIFKSGELTENSVAEEFSITATDGKNTKPNTIIWMQLFLLVIVSIPKEPRNSGNGQLPYCGILPFEAMF